MSGEGASDYYAKIGVVLMLYSHHPDQQAEAFNTNKGEFSLASEIYFESHIRHLIRNPEPMWYTIEKPSYWDFHITINNVKARIAMRNPDYLYPEAAEVGATR